MTSNEELTADLEAREAKIKEMGGPEKIKKQHDLNKLIFDAGTFTETGMHVKHRCHHFGMDKIGIPADGVVTGFGKVNGRTVCCYAQDFTSQGGSLGEMHAWKIAKTMDLAAKMKAPMIGMQDTGGARIQEGVSPYRLDNDGERLQLHVCHRSQCSQGGHQRGGHS